MVFLNFYTLENLDKTIERTMSRIPDSDPPIFTINSERSINGSPKISLTFSNNQTDNLILRKFYTNDSTKSLIDGEEDTCSYIGHLENEKEACVAVTGCFGAEDLYLSIASKHAKDSGLYKWSIEGNIEVIEHPMMNRKHMYKGGLNRNSPAQHKNDEIHTKEDLELDMIFEELCRRKIDWICAIHSEKAYNKNSNCVQKSHTLEYKVNSNKFLKDLDTFKAIAILDRL